MAVQKIILNRLAHVYYIHKDVEPIHNFLVDFGLREVTRASNKTYYRGYGTEPFLMCVEAGDHNAFGGAAFVVESEKDLEHAMKILPPETRPTPIHDLDAPGGGKCVTFYDPVDQCPFHLVWGQTPAEPEDPQFPELKVNYPNIKHREVNKFQRFQKGPAPIHKLGHFGVACTDFARWFDFFTTYFNLRPSDIIHNPDNVDEMAFCRLDRGKELVDHHIFFFYQGPRFHVHHSSFESHDFDIQSIGHHWLRNKGYKNCWGIGRHVLGSQIFDYWFDPTGFIFEHYVDGDLLDDSEPTHRNLVSHDNLHAWGPEVPAGFMNPSEFVG